jgi:hypothetical protein
LTTAFTPSKPKPRRRISITFVPWLKIKISDEKEASLKI